jgi:hypothetical protein
VLDLAAAQDAKPELLTSAAVAVAQAQFFAAEAARAAGSSCSRPAAPRRRYGSTTWTGTGGTPAPSRTTTPRAYKAAVAGAYWLNGTEPPGSLF